MRTFIFQTILEALALGSFTSPILTPPGLTAVGDKYPINRSGQTGYPPRYRWRPLSRTQAAKRDGSLAESSSS